MGILFPDPPKAPQIPLNPNQAQVAPVSPGAAPWYQGDQIAHGIAQGEAEAQRLRRQTGGTPVPPPPPGEYRPR